MTPDALIISAIMLGLFVLAGGSYGALYGAGRIWRRPQLIKTGFACYGLQVLVTLAIVGITPLSIMWKVFILLSCLAYALIPPATWRYLERLHHTEGKTT
jgi:hypothetical protein